MKKDAFNFIIIISIITAIVILIIDSVVLHKNYQYFGGYALNRPHALENSFSIFFIS